MLYLAGNDNLRVNGLVFVNKDGCGVLAPFYYINGRAGSGECTCYGAVVIATRSYLVPIVGILRQTGELVRYRGYNGLFVAFAHCLIGP